MPRIAYRGGDMDGRYEDRLVEPEDDRIYFDGYGGRGSPRGIYVKTNEIVIADHVEATVWQCIDSLH